jgi:phage terminase large subunit-like protein
MSEVGWRPLRRLAGQIPGAEIRKVDRQVILPGGGEVTVRSADNPDSLRGEGLDFVVLDECAFMLETAWNEALRPALADRKGRALFISTPKGRNWFWRIWQRAASDGGEWHGWQFTSYDNPFIADSEIDAAKAMLPDRIFRQEFMAEFIDDAGGVFRRVMDAATAQQQDDPTPGHSYVFGVDWGKHNDFTVITVLDLTDKSLVYFDRFNQIDYVLQAGRLKALAGRFKPTTVVAESNSIGDPVIEQLRRDGLPVTAFNTTSATKTAAIDALALAFEQGSIRILNDPILIGELQAYEMERLPSGQLRYNAPAGMHDDCVMSLAIGWTGVTNTPWLMF